MLVTLLLATTFGARPDPLLAVTARGCGVPVERLAAEQHTTLRTLPVEPKLHWEWDPEVHQELWDGWVETTLFSLTDTTGDRRADLRERDVRDPDQPDRRQCLIEERWRGGRWHLVTIERYGGAEAITTHYRGDRRARETRRSSVVH